MSYAKAIQHRQNLINELKATGCTDASTMNAIRCIQDQIDLLSEDVPPSPPFHVALMGYLVALRAEGFTRLHVSDAIPSGRSLPRGILQRSWNQFPKIDQALLDEYDVAYDQYSGWFTL